MNLVSDEDRSSRERSETLPGLSKIPCSLRGSETLGCMMEIFHSFKLAFGFG
jgi:hypothetical protein